MTDLLQEVDDMMRQEKLAKLWREHGNFIIGVILAIILATALVSAYKSWNSHVRQSQTTALMEALEKPDFAENAPEALKDLRPGLKSIGLLNAAGKALKDKKPEEAAALFKTVAEDSSTPGDLADFALIMEMRLAKPAEQAAFLPKLEKIAGSSSSPWRFHAATEAAVLKASAQDYQGARALLLPM
ncbi:MAG: hypothetical protein LRY39_01445, partial [Alphaproteobacteria bacterium]|nr:hypothetical protein [Alphaproteobacteria bacterium]